MKALLDKFNKKQLACSSCGRRMQVPVRRNKTLRVTCPHCGAKFDIRFASPLGDILQWNKNQDFGSNLRNMLARVQQLPRNAKLYLLILVISFAFLIAAMIGQAQLGERAPTKSNAPGLELEDREKNSKSDLLDT